MPKSKKPKDVNAPKKPLSSYFLFSNERRAVMAKEMPDKKLTELSKLISVEWKELDPDTKATYSQRWQEAKEEYATRFAEYKQTPEFAAYQRKLKAWKNEQSDRKDDFDSDNGGASSASRSKISLPRKPKDENCPKRSKTSYFLFGDSVREATKAEHPDKPITEIAKLIGAKWKQLSDEEKRPFSDEAARLKEIYTEQLKRYKGSAEEKAFARRMEEWKAECERRRQRAAVKRTSTKKGGAKGKTKRSRVEEDSSEEESESGSGSEEDSSDESGSSEEDSSSDSQSSSDGS